MSEKKKIQFFISGASVILLLIHTIWPEIRLDAISVSLLIIAILPWLAPVFKSFELPGGLKVEFHDIEQATKKLESSGLVQPGREPSGTARIRSKYAFLNVVDPDSSLALSALRTEIEMRLRDIADRNAIPSERRGVASITRKLVEKNILSSDEAAAILDVLPVLNKAVHGGAVDPYVHKWAIDIGPQILDALETRIGSQNLPELISAFKQRDGGQAVELGYELSKHLVKATAAFFSAMETEPDAFRDWLKELDVSTFTMFQSQDEIEEQLYEAQYEKMKDLMTNCVETFLSNNKGHTLANQVLDRLKQITIQSIW